MRIETLHGNAKYCSLWLRRGDVQYGIEWHSKGPIRKRALLRAKSQVECIRFGAPWLWAKGKGGIAVI